MLLRLSQFIVITLLYCTSAFAQQQSFLPIVFVHGFLGSGDTYATQFQRFRAAGYNKDLLYVYDWNSVGVRINNSVRLDSFIQDVLKKTGAKQVNLVGHSAGGGIGYAYLNDSLYATRVANYVHIGSSKAAGPAGKQQQIRTLNIFSPDDKIAKSGEIPGAINSEQKGSDHYQVATSEASFTAMYNFFNKQAPAVFP
ncbi:MAG: alpha/beta fold hydrolase, partial [Chitinophagaceae bacterium]|nr:alpha/beta fold hydrolase [Chitinophagaceae bacterium]